jgi:hypothetical protein
MNGCAKLAGSPSATDLLSLARDAGGSSLDGIDPAAKTRAGANDQRNSLMKRGVLDHHSPAGALERSPQQIARTIDFLCPNQPHREGTLAAWGRRGVILSKYRYEHEGGIAPFSRLCKS